MSIMYTNIQRMCMHDGPGIRTTVFLKGCNLNCPWCCNPENINMKTEYYVQQEKCKKAEKKNRFCHQCQILPGKFPSETIIKDSVCPFGNIGVYGREIESAELMEILLRDKAYWGVDGGVTFSGGEALLQIEQFVLLLALLKKENIHIAFETALHVSLEKVKLACRYADFFYVDVKILDSEMCRRVLHGNVECFLQNVEKLVQEKKEIIFRVPCCDEYTLTEQNQQLLMEFFQRYRKIPIEIFAVHSLGKKKYDSLNRKCLEHPSKEKMLPFYEKLTAQKNKVKIIHM